MIGADLPRRRFVAILVGLIALGAVLRTMYLAADPPWRAPVGITWHDEGPWVHNARNKVLWGRWSTDAWNPMYVTPVFTGLEYVAMRDLGVGQWQVRVVPVVMGLISIVAIGLGAAAAASRGAGAIAAALMATNYVWVMWNRAALMEGTMVAFITLAWAAYALAQRRPWCGVVAGAAAVLAFFTKAAAAFFVAAIGVEILFAWLLPRVHAARPPAGDAETADAMRRGAHAALWTAAGLAAAGLGFAVFFVLPHWTEFRFYNWQMSVTRKPSYGLAAFVDRASWLPIVHDFFTRQWAVTVLALVSLFVTILQRWSARAPERLLAGAVTLGVAELIVHDVGNERRLVFLIPLQIALAAILLARGRLLPAGAVRPGRTLSLLLAPFVLYASYIACGAIARLPFLYQVRPGVRTAAAAAVVLTCALYAFRRQLFAWADAHTWSWRAAVALVAVVMAGDVVQFGQWAAARTYKNVEASRLVGTLLPPGTAVQGKLANGLALENRIRPIFIGRGFGNYDDRFARDDVRYILTYLSPRAGYEGPVITDLLEGCRGWRILKSFDVAETAGGHDRAALILKPPHCSPVPRSVRADH